MHGLQLQSIHHSLLRSLAPGDRFFEEWETYRECVGRLLAAGHEGSFIVIKGSRIVGIYKSFHEAEAATLAQNLSKEALIHQIRVEEPVLKSGFRKICRN